MKFFFILTIVALFYLVKGKLNSKKYKRQFYFNQINGGTQILMEPISLMESRNVSHNKNNSN
jgi:hypothetical protein